MPPGRLRRCAVVAGSGPGAGDTGCSARRSGPRSRAGAAAARRTTRRTHGRDRVSLTPAPGWPGQACPVSSRCGSCLTAPAHRAGVRHRISARAGCPCQPELLDSAGRQIAAQHADRKLARGRRSVNGAIALRVPITVVKAKCAPYLRLGKPEHRPERVAPRRSRDRQHLRRRIPGDHPVLPAGRRLLATEPAALGHADLDAQDPGRQAPLNGDDDGPQAQGHHRHTVRAATVL